MNGNELIDALDVQPCLDTNVQVSVDGSLIDVTAVGFDRARHTIVVHLSAGGSAESPPRPAGKPRGAGTPAG